MHQMRIRKSSFNTSNIALHAGSWISFLKKKPTPRRIDRHIARSRFHLNTKLMTENLPTPSLARGCKPRMNNKRNIVLCLDQDLSKKAMSWLQPVKNLRKPLETANTERCRPQQPRQRRNSVGNREVYNFQKSLSSFCIPLLHENVWHTMDTD